MATSPYSTAPKDEYPLSVPQLTVQHDFLAVIDDVQAGTIESEDFWVSVYLNEKPSVHGKVRLARSNNNEDRPSSICFEARDGVLWHGSSTDTFAASCPTLDVPLTRIQVPSRTYGTPSKQPHAITSFDVAPNGGLYATGHADGSISVCPTLLERLSTSVVEQDIPSPTSPTPLSRQLSAERPSTEYTRPHLSTVLSVRFFPSSSVLLTSSSDHTLRIHDALSPTLTTVRILIGHTAAVTGIAVVDRGRNVLSASKDGTIRLWDVGGAKEIALRRWSTGTGAVAALCLDAGEGRSGYESSLGGEGNSGILAGPGEVGTENKLVLAGLQDGRVEGFDLRSKRSAFSFSSKRSGQYATSSAAIDSIVFASDSSMLAAGARDGILRWWDVRSCGRGEGPPLCEFKRNGAGIESLAWVPAEWTRTSEETKLDEREGQSRVEGQVPVTLGGESLAKGLPHLVIGTADGLPWRAGMSTDAKAVVVEEYVGYACGDGVRVVQWCTGGEAGLGRGVWCAGDDGLVRFY